MLDDIPEELRSRDQWILWKRINKGDRVLKMPFSVGGSVASVNDIPSLSTFDKCCESLESYDGLGFVLTGDDLVAIDIDDCFDGKSITNPEIRQIIKSFNETYMEISPSGRGVRIMCRGEWPKDGSRCAIDGHSLEVYTNRRYVTITGNSATRPALPVVSCQYALKSLWSIYFKDKDISEVKVYKSKLSPSLNEVIELCKKRRKNFIKLYQNGDISEYNDDKSRADLALCTIIASYTRDEEIIDGIFRSSKLMREKWDREDYRIPTIKKALAYSLRRVQNDNNKQY